MPRSIPVLLSAFALCAYIGPASSQILVLKMGWGPAFCTVANRTMPFCSTDLKADVTAFNAFRINRLFAIDAAGKDITDCPNQPDFDPALVPEELLPELQCVWNSYQEPANNDELWSSVWFDPADPTYQPGKCTGLAQEEWLRTALELRSRYDLDGVFRNMGVLNRGQATGVQVLAAISAVFGKTAAVTCNKKKRDLLEISSVSLCFNATDLALMDCPLIKPCTDPFVVPTVGQPVSAKCARFYLGVEAVTLPDEVIPELVPVAPPFQGPSVAVTPPMIVLPPLPAPNPLPLAVKPPSRPFLPNPPPPEPPSLRNPSFSPPPKAPSPPSPLLDGGSSTMGSGVLAGIAVGAVLALVVALLVGFLLYRRHRGNRPLGIKVGAGRRAGNKTNSFLTSSDVIISPRASTDSFEDMCGGAVAAPAAPSSRAAAFKAAARVGFDSLESSSNAGTASLSTSPTYQHSSTEAACTQGASGTMQNLFNLAFSDTMPPTPALAASMAAQWREDSNFAQASNLPTARNEFEQDYLLWYIKSQVSTPTTAGDRSTGRSGGGVDVQPWAMSFSELSIIELIGEGSFSKVYSARWNEILVACKVLLMSGANCITNAKAAQRALTLSSPIVSKLEEEASLMASLRHPNVVSFLGICFKPPCIITEHCAHGSLADVLFEARHNGNAAAELTWPRRLAMAMDAAVGVLYLHTRPSPIVHRDLKSANLLVSTSWTVKVTDFNLSKFIEERGAHNSSAAAMNPRWLAPEVMRGEHATQASDVFSFAVVLWELLTWEVPWRASNPWQIVNFVLSGGRLEIPPRERMPGTCAARFQGLDAYTALMQSCWVQDPMDRPAFPGIIAQLRAILDETQAPDCMQGSSSGSLNSLEHSSQ